MAKEDREAARCLFSANGWMKALFGELFTTSLEDMKSELRMMVKFESKKYMGVDTQE